MSHELIHKTIGKNEYGLKKKDYLNKQHPLQKFSISFCKMTVSEIHEKSTNLNMGL